MQRFATGLVTAIVLCWTVPAPAAAPDRAKIEKLLTTLPDAKTQCSALIVDLDTGEDVYALNAAQPLTPASNQKLFVLAAALDELGPTWTFKTKLGMLGDDLVIIGDGDPALGDPRIAEDGGQDATALLDAWADAVSSKLESGTRVGFVVDASVFDDQFFHPEWEDEDKVRWYGAPIGGLNLNDNCVEFTVWPQDAGQPAAWAMHPACPIAEVVNRCDSAPGAGNPTPTIGRYPDSFKFALGGKVAKRMEVQPSVPVYDPVAFSAEAVRHHLETKGIRVADAYRLERVKLDNGQPPANFELIAEHDTPLPDVMLRIGRDSQNMFAECLFKRLGYEHELRNHREAIGSWATGRRAVFDFLRSIKADTAHMTIADASGLSRRNLSSAADFVHLLKHMHTHKDGDAYKRCLAGTETGGTLRKRVEGVEGTVYAKTGYMRGIRTLSGYVQNTEGKWYAFSILFNGPFYSSRPYTKIQTDIVEMLAE